MHSALATNNNGINEDIQASVVK